jgi:hypothetical protein
MLSIFLVSDTEMNPGNRVLISLAEIVERSKVNFTSQRVTWNNVLFAEDRLSGADASLSRTIALLSLF